MAGKKHIYESSVMILPPLRLVLGEVPSPDPEKKRRTGKNGEKVDPDLEAPIRRLIAHLEEKK